MKAAPTSLLHLLALALVVVALACGGAEADQRITIGHTSASLVLPGDFVPIQMAAHVEGVMSEAMSAGIGGLQQPDELFFRSVTDSRFFGFLSMAKKTGFFPADAQFEDLHRHGRDFIIVSYEKKLATVIEHDWQVSTGPAPTVNLQFRQLEWPDKPILFNRAKVLELLDTLEVGPPLSFEEMLSETDLTATAGAPFALREVLGGQVILSTADTLSPVPGATYVMLGYRDDLDATRPLDEIIKKELAAGTVLDSKKPIRFMGVDGLRLTGHQPHDDSKPDSFVRYAAAVGGRVVLLLAYRTGLDLTADQVNAIDEIAKSARPASQIGAVE